ncbi:NFACT family protein [Ruminococcaceae bacterium OttesenSCG-928-I18]|nr:NFACT family protein [Ruminococcaceae bacterium OttesenSCG-928-I18]
MALDAATLALTGRELLYALAEARIDKIHQPTRDEVLLQMRSRRAGFSLLIAARTGSARVCLTEMKYDNPPVPPSFCMLLRKHLSGGRLIGMHTPEAERILFLDFQCVNEMGDLVYNTLAAELMGRYCNIVLFRKEPDEQGQLHDGKIIDALKRVDFEDSEVRQLLPGLAYTLPPKREMPDLLREPAVLLTEKLMQSELPVGDALRKMAGGVGPVLAREVCYRAFGTSDPAAGALSEAQQEAFREAVYSIRADFEAGGRPNLVRREDGTPVEFSFTPLTQYEPAGTLVFYDTFSQMLEGYYAEKDRTERLRQKSKALRKTVQNLYDRAVRKQAARTEELASSEDSEHLRIKGELLTANLHAFQKGEKQVTLANWYKGGEMTSIPLDVRLSPSANAQKYFKEYKKKQTAAKKLAQLLNAGKREIAYLETVLYEVEQAEGENALGEIRAELKNQGYLKYYKQRDKKQKPADFLRYRSSDGFLILVGRNNAQNEKLTLKTARGKDLWFHTKNAPGSHVVVMSEGREIPLSTQNEAAMLAVWHSSQKNGAKIPVDYTEVKNIRKTNDLPPGMVLYEHYETAYVTPEEEALRTLQQRQV